MALFTHLLTLLFPLVASFPDELSGQMLYLLHRGEVEKAFVNYLNHAKSTETHDFQLLQHATIRLLESGIESSDPEIQVMCMFGAGVATTQELIPILEKGIQSKDLKTQLIALSYLGRQQDDLADAILLEALGSPFLLTRLEALLQLAQKNHPAVMGHLHSLMVKVPAQVRPVFSQIAVHIEDVEANRYLRQLLNDSDLDVRLETILTVAKEGRDDFLPQIRTLSGGGHHAQQECCALAFGELKDYQSLPKLKEFATSKRENVRLAASIALYTLGQIEYLSNIQNMAQEGYLYAISALGKLKKGKKTCLCLLSHPERDVRLNAIIALLNMREKEVIPHLNEILIEDSRDIGFTRSISAGGGLKAWKTIPSANAHTKDYFGLKGQTTALREQVLIQCLEFEENDFLAVSQMIFDKQLNNLVPVVVELLQNKKSEAVIELLKKGYQKAGAPLIRNYCTLALYRLKEEGTYENELIAWVKERGNEEIIRFREEESDGVLSKSSQLTPEETSRFLIEAFETLAAAQNQAGIEALIHTIAYGNPKNRYALAGLLMRTTE